MAEDRLIGALVSSSELWFHLLFSAAPFVRRCFLNFRPTLDQTVDFNLVHEGSRRFRARRERQTIRLNADGPLEKQAVRGHHRLLGMLAGSLR